jgi:P27 family predicted phage terminase small subunit
MSSKLSPPPEITEEALLEWCRVVSELPDPVQADRAILTIYCQTWEIHQQAMRGVGAHGAIVKFGNGVAGKSPFYTVSRETAAQLEKLLVSLGLTPAARMKLKAPTESPSDLEF